MADYLRPTSLDDALAALADRSWTMLAGGTDVYPANVGHLVSDDILHNRVRWDPRLGTLLTAILVLAGILLAVYLIITA